MTKSGSLLESGVFAVLTVCLAAFLVGCASMIIPYWPPHKFDDILATGVIGFICALVTLPCAIVVVVAIGLPILHFSRRRGLTSIHMYALVGLAIAGLTDAIMLGIHDAFNFVPNDADFRLATWIATISGPLAALTVRHVAGPNTRVI
jgi:hypothetical protein